MSVNIRKIAPLEIEAESFRMIEEELGTHNFDPATFQVVRRVIHATGDFSFADNLRFSPEALARGIEALQQGRGILTDVNMVAMGISKPLLAKWGNRVFCAVADEKVKEAAVAGGTTRAEAAIQLGLTDNIGIIAVGNAPTALLKAMSVLATWPSEEVPLIVGVPVGFVNAAESKELLARSELPHITSLGRKGGSPVAAAIVNALIRLAAE